MYIRQTQSIFLLSSVDGVRGSRRVIINLFINVCADSLSACVPFLSVWPGPFSTKVDSLYCFQRCACRQ